VVPRTPKLFAADAAITSTGSRAQDVIIGRALAGFPADEVEIMPFEF
jgi:hypothetical protein